MHLLRRVQGRLVREWNLIRNGLQVRRVKRYFLAQGVISREHPVVFFNASTRLSGLSQNAGFSLIASFVVRAAGIPVSYFVCERGLSKCVLGTDREKPHAPPPCAECTRTSSIIFNPMENVTRFQFQPDITLQRAIDRLSLSELVAFSYHDLPLGEIVLPSLRWILRKHHLSNNEGTRHIARGYIQSAWSLYNAFKNYALEKQPRAVVVFNGMFFPEAVVSHVCRELDIPDYSHEVGMLPLSAFFTDQEATAYPVRVDQDFQLSDQQNQRLDDYLNNRMQGKFVTAGVKFWPEMVALGDSFWKRASQFQSIIPIFTNVVFDTSQGHANVLFDHMFAWLDVVKDAIQSHPESLFVIRAHPDEMRKGKESRETVAEWFQINRLEELRNVIFISPRQHVSSYQLIQKAKFIMVYNSTIGLEASIMGKPVLCAGKARYTMIPTVNFPNTVEAYQASLDEFLNAETIHHPHEFIQNARGVLYSQLFRASLPFDQYLVEDGVWRGYVRLRPFDPRSLTIEKTPQMGVVLNGIRDGSPFIRE